MRERWAPETLPKRYFLGIPLVVVAALAAGLTPVGVRPAGTAVVLGLMALASWSHNERLAWCWGFLLPIDFIENVPSEVLDVVRYGAVVWLCLAFAPDLSSTRRSYVWKLAALVGAVAVIRGIGSTARSDRFGMYIAAGMLVGAVASPFIAHRVRSHVFILAGFMAGVLLSATVSLMQWLDIPTLQAGNQGGDRFPGVASTTMLTTWHLAFALLIAVYFLRDARHRTLHRATAGLVVPLGLVALVGNGAQGGLLGLGAAAVFVFAWRWRRESWRAVAPYVLGGAAVLVLLATFVLVADIQTPTIAGLRGEGGYENETSRFEVDQRGLEVMIDHPLVGVGRTNFEDQYALAPHFLPLEAGITSGVLGLVMAAYLLWTVLLIALRGPVGGRPAAWLGLALVAAMWSNTLVEMGGPFTGLPRFTLLLIAVVACRGEPWPADGDEERSAEVPGALETASIGAEGAGTRPPGTDQSEAPEPPSAPTTRAATRSALPASWWAWWSSRA